MKTLNSFGLLCAAGLAATALGHAAPAHALSFDFLFDNSPDGTVTPPIVGAGTFSFDGDPGLGDFALTSLPNFDFAFNIDTSSFSNADIATPLDNVLVRISQIGSDFSVSFGGSSGGPNLGSIDFNNAGDVLSFQPDFGSLYFSVPAKGQFFGTYQGIATSAPPPCHSCASVPGPLPLLGVGAAFGFSRKIRRRIKSSRSEGIPATTV